MYWCSFKGFCVDLYSDQTNRQTFTNIDLDTQKFSWKHFFVSRWMFWKQMCHLTSQDLNLIISYTINKLEATWSKSKLMFNLINFLGKHGTCKSFFPVKDAPISLSVPKTCWHSAFCLKVTVDNSKLPSSCNSGTFVVILTLFRMFVCNLNE